MHLINYCSNLSALPSALQVGMSEKYQHYNGKSVNTRGVYIGGNIFVKSQVY